MAICLTLVPVREAKATESMRGVTETDLRDERINATNWMSGLSGELYLHQINIPGSHDSGMRDATLRFNPGIMSTMTKYANTQTLGIDEQLQAGIRLFDLRLTDLCPRTYEKDLSPLWICYGPNLPDIVFSSTYYSELPKSKRTKGESRFLTSDNALQYYADFLREHPTETLVMKVVHETGDDNLIYQRANAALKKWAPAINPSTGKSYIYKEPRSKDGCRGHRERRCAHRRKRYAEHNRLHQDGCSRYGRRNVILVPGGGCHECGGCCRDAGLEEA